MALLDTTWRSENDSPAGPLAQTFDFLNGLARSGLTVATYQPTPGMIAAGAKAGEITPSQAKAIYLAMISHNE